MIFENFTGAAAFPLPLSPLRAAAKMASSDVFGLPLPPALLLFAFSADASALRAAAAPATYSVLFTRAPFGVAATTGAYCAASNADVRRASRSATVCIFEARL